MIATSRAVLKLRSAVSTLLFAKNAAAEIRSRPRPSRRALGDGEAGLVQQRRLALRGRDDHAGIGAGDHRFGKFGFHQGGLTGERAVDDRIEFSVRRRRRPPPSHRRASPRLCHGHRARASSIRCARPGGRRRAATSAPRGRPERCAGSRPSFRRRSVARDRARRRDNSRSRPRSWRARRPCAAAIPGATRRPRSRCGNLLSAYSASVSTPEAKLREPARTRIARRPPNIGMVIASSTSRDGSAESSSPSSRTSENGSLGSSTADAISASARSRTRPASGPYSRMMGRAGSGLAEKYVDVPSAQRDHVSSFRVVVPGASAES